MKLLSLLLCMCFLISPSALAEDVLSIIALNFPAYDFARSIAGDTARIEMLLPPGSESHSYEPTPHDIIAIQNCNLFIYVGGESDTWVESIIASMDERAPHTFRLSDPVTLLSSEVTASMEDHHSHEHGEECDDPDHIHTDIHQHGMDEHVWTSPKNAKKIVSALCDTLCQIAPANKDIYEAATAEYLIQLNELDRTFESIVANAQRDVLIFGDRFPFRYFADAYSLHYDAAFPGCSEDSEPSVRTVISLVNTVREQKIPVVFYIEFSSKRTADILAEETGAKTLLFHSCHNVSAAEIANGATYLSLMWQNTDALKEALN